MIRINALYFLLLVELLVIFAGLIAFLAFRGKKHLAACRESKKELDSAHAAHEELQQKRSHRRGQKRRISKHSRVK